MQPEDLGAYRTPSDPQLHPDGARAAFVVTRLDLEKDRYHRTIWLADHAGPREFTAGPGDTSPRWSPDGAHLAFLRHLPDAEPQVATMAIDGGEARLLTDFPLGATEIAWSPDGRRLAVVAATWTEEWDDLDDEERSRRPRRLTHLGHRFDNQGWLHDRRSHIYLIDPFAEDGDPVPLTSGDEFTQQGVAWHPAGKRVAFLSARHDERYVDGAVAVWEVAVGTDDGGAGEIRQIAAPGAWSVVSYAPDGTCHAVGDPDVWAFPNLSSLFRLGDDGPTDITGELDRSMLSLAPKVTPPGPQWTKTGFISLFEHEGGTRLVRFDAAGEHTDLAAGNRAITGVTVNDAGTTAVMTIASPTSPGEVVMWEDGAERPVTDLNGDFVSGAGLVVPERFTFERDGRTIEAWAYLPPGKKQVPLLLNIHGGPASQYGWTFFDEFQVYVGAGYGVVACNPRGSAGYGLDFMRSVVGVWREQKSPDLLDIQAAADAALARFPRLDPERMGVMGGSYGGLATTRLLSFDHRFKSAIVERALTAFTSFGGTSDIGPRFGRSYLGLEAPGDWEELWQASPLATAGAISTPTLVIHSDTDYRTPIEQGEQLFTLLSRLGVETEMVRFPGESHELSRSGKPRHRRERFDIVLEWHARHIPPGGLAT